MCQIFEGPSGDGRTEFQGNITEIGSRAAQVSGFPVVVLLEEGSERIKAGMSAEVTLDIALEGAEEGYVLPGDMLCFWRTRQWKSAVKHGRDFRL